MAETDKVLKQGIAEFLRGHGLSVENIPTSTKKTPDLWVHRGKPDSLLLEIKAKEDDAQEIADLESRLKSGQVVGRSKPTDRWNRLSAIVVEAIVQMEAFDSAHASYHLLWFQCTGIDAMVAETRMEATLYGTQTLVSTNVPGLITAYYYHPSAFFRFRDSLDGVIIGLGEKAGLKLNPFAPRVQALQATKFAAAFRSPPMPTANRPDIMICDSSAPRGDETAMLTHLRQSYGLAHLQVMNMGFHSGWVEAATVPGSAAAT